MVCGVTDDRVLRNMSKGGPQTRPNRPTKPRHRPSDIGTHLAVYQRRTVARGSKAGSADPTCQPMRLCFGGKLDLIRLKCNTGFTKGHKPSNHIRTRIKSHVYTIELIVYHSTYHVKRYNKENTNAIYYIEPLELSVFSQFSPWILFLA